MPVVKQRRCLKDGAVALAEPITKLYSLSILQSTFPDGCKQAKLKPLFKKGSKDDPKNYRPISQLPQLSNLIEKNILGQVQKYLDERKYYVNTNPASRTPFSKYLPILLE